MQLLNFNVAITKGNRLLIKARAVVEYTGNMVKLIFLGSNNFNINTELEVVLEYQPTNDESLLVEETSRWSL